MVIKSINIKNFRSYYSNNHFELSNGLTLIIGGNGDGKTTFFEALEWLFNTSAEEMKKSNISEKRKAELEIGECDDVIVSIKFEHNGEKEIEKSYTFERALTNDITCRDFKFIGYVNEGTERNTCQGQQLLEECFDAAIRKYCLFKGESTLNVFDNPAALKKLVEIFSGIRQFEELVELTTNFEQKSHKAATTEMKNDRNCKTKANVLLAKIETNDNEISTLKKDIKTQEDAITVYNNRLDVLEQNHATCEQYETIKKRIKALSDKRTTLKVQTEIDYNARLLDNEWILSPYSAILSEYFTKIAAVNKEKRKLEKQEIEQKAREAGSRETMANIQTLANNAVPLPWNLPDKETMEEMLKDHVCKVCGREAPEGSKAYEFMKAKLNDYLRHIQDKIIIPSKTEEKPLFPNSFIEELHTRKIKMSGETEQQIAQIKRQITDDLESIQARKNDLSKIERELQGLEDEKSRLLIQSPNLTEEMLEKEFNDIRGYFDHKGRAEKRIVELTEQLKQKERAKEELDDEFAKLKPENHSVIIIQNVHNALKMIMDAFINAKEKNITEFLQLLESNANKYLKQLNENDFHGVIRLKRTTDGSVRIELNSENGIYIHNPSDSQKTTMYMSVLFAISDVTTLKREQDYPLLFDAPTSNMGGFKENSFYNVIDGLDKQCIIVTKDLLIEDKATGESRLDDEQINQLTCSVYRISKADNFSQTELSTIQTISKKIK